MKVKTLRSILQTGAVLAVTLLVTLAVILIVQFVQIKNAEDKLEDLGSGSASIEYAMDFDYDERCY